MSIRDRIQKKVPPPPVPSGQRWYRLRTIDGRLRDRLMTRQEARNYERNPDFASVEPIDTPLYNNHG